MSKLYYIHHTALATRRGRIRPLQRMWPLSQASWHTSTYIPQNGRDQESQSCEDGRSRTEAKGQHISKIPTSLLIKCYKSRCLTVTPYPHLNLRVLLLQLMPTISEYPSILDLIARFLQSRATKPPPILPTSLLNISSTAFRH